SRVRSSLMTTSVGRGQGRGRQVPHGCCPPVPYKKQPPGLKVSSRRSGRVELVFASGGAFCHVARKCSSRKALWGQDLSVMSAILPRFGGCRASLFGTT